MPACLSEYSVGAGKDAEKITCGPGEIPSVAKATLIF